MLMKKRYSKAVLTTRAKHFFRCITVFCICAMAAGCIGSKTVSDADNDQVITLGDSIFDLSGEIQATLEGYARQTFRKYTKSAAELEGGFLALSVYDQYDLAMSDNADIDTIVMNGGGNDILIPAVLFDPYNCRVQWWEWGHLSGKCKDYIDDLYVQSVNLLNDMYADGVNNVIYLGYYYTKGGVDNLEEAVDYGDQTLAFACTNTAVDCAFVDPRSAINDSDIIFDGIHPARSGSLKLADLIWPHLQPLL
ncbi:MAG: SGNH/GDSL hydrolase family protein [Proteobacteria bacterium]|nr:SGNH/GDSL hydrolase family protein [Pseudomonadota bacterium]